MFDVGERRALGDDDDASVVHLVDAGIEAAGQRLHGLAHDAQMVRLLVIGPEQTQMQLARHAAGAVTVQARDEVEQQLVIGQRPRLFVVRSFIRPTAQGGASWHPSLHLARLMVNELLRFGQRISTLWYRSGKSRRAQRRCSHQPDFVDREDRVVVPDGVGGHHRGDLVVQQHRLVADIDHQHGVAEIEVLVLQRDHAHVLDRHAERLQREVFGDGVVLAIAVLLQELVRRRPVVLFAPVLDVEDVAVRVEGAVHFLELGLEILALELGDELVPALGGAGRALARLAAVLEPVEHAEPLGKARGLGREQLDRAEDLGILARLRRRGAEQHDERRRRPP